MEHSKRALFREEAIKAKSPSLYGNASMAVPIKWQVTGFLLLTAFVSIVAYTLTSDFRQSLIVSGQVVLDKGIVPIVPLKPGVVTALYIKDGDVLTAGSPIAKVQVGDMLSNGASVQAETLKMLNIQNSQLRISGDMVLRSRQAELARAKTKIGAAQADIESLNQQISAQKEILQIMTSELESVDALARRGFVSGREINRRRTELLQQRQQLLGLQKNRASSQAALMDASEEVTQISTSAASQIAQIQASQTEIGQRQIATLQGDQILITAPVDGKSTATQAKVGQVVTSQSIMTILVPKDARKLIELKIPTRASGKLQVGQAVRVSVDAFPYQQYGFITGRIAYIAAAASKEEDLESGPSYTVTVEIEKQSINSYGQHFDLSPGMTVSAKIVTKRQKALSYLISSLRGDAFR